MGLAEQLWLDPAKQRDVAANSGVETFLSLCAGWKDEDEKVLLPALWALRNVTHDHPPNKDRVGDLDGIDVLLDVCHNHTHFSTGDVLESALSALVNVCVGHERNCRRILRRGLDVLIDIAEGVNLSLDAAEVEVEGEIQDEELRSFEMEKVTERRKSAVLESQKTNRALATNLLQILGPHN